MYKTPYGCFDEIILRDKRFIDTVNEYNKELYKFQSERFYT